MSAKIYEATLCRGRECTALNMPARVRLTEGSVPVLQLKMLDEAADLAALLNAFAAP